MVWPGNTWHGIWYGLVGMAWYMAWPGVHGMVYGMELWAWNGIYIKVWRASHIVCGMTYMEWNATSCGLAGIP